MKNNFGYASKEPCVVCGKHNNNMVEPHFGYTVCIDHQDIPPVEIARIREARQGGDNR